MTEPKRRRWSPRKLAEHSNPRVGLAIVIGLVVVGLVFLTFTVLAVANRITATTQHNAARIQQNAAGVACTELLTMILASDTPPTHVKVPAGCDPRKVARAQQASALRVARRNYLTQRIDQLTAELTRHGIPIPPAPPSPTP